MSGMIAPTGCPYCGTQVAAAGPSPSTCPACGAPLDVAVSVSASGWIELPAARDMARIQCGRSSVQIEGKIVPVADFALAPGDGVYFPHHELLWKEPAVRVTQRGLAGAWKRLMAGLPVHMLDATGPGRIAFSRDAPGETLAVPVHPGVSVDVREHLFMVATHSVSYDWFDCGVWFRTGSGDDAETHYPIGRLMDRFTAPSEPGLLLIHAHGNAFLRQLAPGERILVKPVGASLQGLHGLGAPALRASPREHTKHLDLGRALHVARPLGPRVAWPCSRPTATRTTRAGRSRAARA